MVAPIYMEGYVMASLAIHHIAAGFMLAFPAPFKAGITTSGLRDIHTTTEEATWIISSFSFAAAISYFILPPLSQVYGRRFINVIYNLLILFGAIVIALASNVAGLVAGQFIQGLGFAGLPLNCMITAEYSHPRRRSFYLVFTNIATSLGVTLCHYLGFTLTWRQLAWIEAVFPAIGAISTVLWPESPSWLAYKGRNDECVKAFEKLRGNNPESRKEMRQLISGQQKITEINKIKGNLFIRIVKTFRCKAFLKPFAISCVMEALAHASGIYFMMTYVIDIMQRLSGDQSKTFYYTIAIDLTQVLAVLISSLIVRVFKIRTVLFYSGSLACFLLGLFCACNYLESIDVLHLNWCTPLILISYSFVCSAGVIPSWVVITSEIFPLQFKGIGVCSTGIVYCLLGLITLKFTSSMLYLINVYGTFAVYLIISIACLVFLYLLVPETKNKTLQEVELELFKVTLEEDIDVDQKVIDKLIH